MSSPSFFTDPNFQPLVNFIQSLGLDYSTHYAIFEKIRNGLKQIKNWPAQACGVYGGQNIHPLAESSLANFLYIPSSGEYIGFVSQKLARFVEETELKANLQGYQPQSYKSVPIQQPVLDAKNISILPSLVVSPSFPDVNLSGERLTVVFFRAANIYVHSHNGVLESVNDSYRKAWRNGPPKDHFSFSESMVNFDAIRQAGYDVVLDPNGTPYEQYHLLYPRTQITRTSWIEFPFNPEI